MYGHSELLRSLQGLCVALILGVASTPEGSLVSVMAPPHSAGWYHARLTLPEHVKERIVLAYKLLHERGVLHGAVGFEHIIIGTC